MIRKSVSMIKHACFLAFGKESHVKNYHTAEKVVATLKSFSGENIEARQLSYLRKINPYTFEELLLSSLSRAGYRITRNDSYSNDGGIDGVCYSPSGEKLLVQAKRYADHIRLTDVTNFKLLLRKQGIGGFFIHTGKTGKAVWQVIAGSGITIISGSSLLKLIINHSITQYK